jgi:hypothetical protein
MLSSWIAAAALAAGNTPPDTPPSAFRVGTVAFNLPVPEGFCLPEGEDAAAAQLIAASDRDNVTHLSLLQCDEKRRWIDYFLIKTPTVALMATMTNAELQQAVEPELAKGFNSDEIVASVSKEVSDTFRSKVDLKGQIVFLGKDESCLYLGGVFDVAGANGTGYTLAMAQCMTVVEGKMLSIYRYGGGKGRKAVEALMPSTKILAKAIRPTSPR